MALRGYVSELFVSFQGEGTQAGRRQLFIRLAGCNLRCRYCDTPESLERVPSCRVHLKGGQQAEIANPMLVEEVLAHAKTLLAAGPSIDGTALTGGEPLLQEAFLAALLADASLPRPRLLETNGMLPDRLAGLLPSIDLISMDVKLPSNSGERPFWDEHERFLALARGKVYVKVLVDGGTDAAEVERAVDLVSRTAPETPLFLQPITLAGNRLDTDPELLDRFFAVARARLGDVRLLPQAHKIMGIA